MGGKAVSQWHGRHIHSECRWSFDRYASRQRGAEEPSPNSYLLEATYPMGKYQHLVGVLVPGLKVNREYRPGYSWIQCGFVTETLTAQISTDDKNRNFIIFWRSAFYVSIKPLLHPTLKYVLQPMTKRFHLPFRLWSAVPTWTPSKKDAEPHPEQGPDQIRQVRSGMRPTDLQELSQAFWSWVIMVCTAV